MHQNTLFQAPSRREKLSIAASGLLIALSAVSFVWKVGPVIEKKLRLLSENTELAQRRAHLNRQLKDLITDEAEANHMARERAKAALFKRFNVYADRVPQFAKEISGMKNRLVIAAKSASDSINKTKKTEKHISIIFAQHVVTPKQMDKDIEKIVSQFIQALEKNREALITAAARRIHEADLPDSQYELPEETLRARIARQVESEREKVYEATADISGDTYTGYGVAEESTQTLNAQVVRFGASNLVIEVIVKAGTTVGLAVGLGIGYIADEWLSRRLQKKVTDNTRRTLSRIRDDIWGNPSTGMKTGMGRAIQHSRDISTAAVNKVILGEI